VNRWIELAAVVDAWRLLPRLFCLAYIYLTMTVTQWFMALPDPTSQQASLVTIVVGGAVGFFTAYTTTGKKK